MEQVHGTHKASKFDSDFLSSVPDNVITDILNRLPIRDAVGTSILARNWRYKWTMLTQLVFDEAFSEDVQKSDGINVYDESNISRLLLHLKGHITKFVLYIPDYKVFNVKDINHWIMFLSEKGIEELTITNFHGTPLKLPSHIFSCLQLKHLKLFNCCLHHHAPGFPNLLSLDFFLVTLENRTFGEVIAQSPLLEILKISDQSPKVKIKLVEIRKLENLKILCLPLCMLDDIIITTSSIFQLGGYLPKLQELYLFFHSCKLHIEANATRWAFPNLKILTLYPLNFSCCVMVLWAFEMIWGSPNLQNLNITAYTNVDPPAHENSSAEVDYNTLGQLQLQSVMFMSFKGSENEICFIKCLLACSPLLKNMVIFSELKSDEKLRFATKLLKLHRASTIAEIQLH